MHRGRPTPQDGLARGAHLQPLSSCANVSRRLLPVLVRTLVAVGGELPSSSRPRDKGERAGEVVQAFVKR